MRRQLTPKRSFVDDLVLLLRLDTKMTLARHLSIHCIRRQIDVARPRDRAAINEDPLKKLGVQQECKRTGQLFSTQLHTPSESVLESDKKTVSGLRLHFDYIPNA